MILKVFQGLYNFVVCIRWVFLIPRLYTSGSPDRSSACSPCTSNCPYITPILGQPHWLPVDARISGTCMPLSQRCPPLPLLFVSLVSYNCTLLPALFTPVVAPVPNHSHPVCARAVWSVHSIVAWASLCLGSLPLHGGNVPSVDKFFLLFFYLF